MVRTRAGATTTGHFDYGALPDELQELICGYAGRHAITLSTVSRATHNAREHLVNGLLKLLERPNGAEGILDGMNKMCRLRWGPLFECCRDPRFRHPNYEWQRRLMHILINKLGGCRGAEAEGEVMALFVALFATTADEDYLMERFRQGVVKLFRLYSLGTDALAVADTALRFGAAYERAGFEMMPSASSDAFGALVALGFADRDGGHGDLMKNMDAIAQKLYPPVLSFDRRRDRHETTVSYCSEPRSLLLGDGSTEAREIYDGRVTLAAVRKKKGGIEEELRLRTLLDDAREDEKEKLLRERNTVSARCLGLPDVMYWAKSMVQGFDVARYLNDPAYRRWVMARCRWGADGDSGEQRGCLQRLWPETWAIASDQQFTRCVGLLEAATTEEEITAALRAFELFYERGNVVGYQERCVDWARLERILSEENEADTFFRNQNRDFLGALRTASDADVYEAFVLIGGARLDDGNLGPFKIPITKEDCSEGYNSCCTTLMGRPFFEVFALAFCYGLTGDTKEIIDDGKGLLDIVQHSIYDFFNDPTKIIFACTYMEIHIVAPNGRVYLLHRWAPGGYGAGARLPLTAPELRRLKTFDHSKFPAIQKLRVVAKAVCDETVASADLRAALKKWHSGERPGDAEHVGAVIAAAEEDGTRLPFVNDDGSSVRVFVHPTAKRETFQTVDGELKTADYLKKLGALPSKAADSEWGFFGDDYGKNAEQNVKALARNRRAVKVRYLRKILVGQELPDVTPDLVWVTVAEMKRLDPSWRDPDPQNTNRHGEGRFVVK